MAAQAYNLSIIFSTRLEIILVKSEKKISIRNLYNDLTFGFAFTTQLKVVILINHLINLSAYTKTKRITLPQSILKL